MAGTTGLEPATSGVTGQRSSQLNYVPGLGLDESRIPLRLGWSGFPRKAFSVSRDAQGQLI